jgi:phage-related minor tail protein
MKEVEALSGFEHGKSRQRGDTFTVSEQHAKALVRAGLVKIVGEAPDAANPSGAAGGKSSASPAAQALTSATVKKPGRGATPKPGAPSS